MTVFVTEETDEEVNEQALVRLLKQVVVANAGGLYVAPVAPGIATQLPVQPSLLSHV